MEFVVYILYSSQYKIHYTGFTSSLIARFKSHNEFGTKGFTKKYRPWIVIYVEFFNNKKDALKREKFLKSGQGRQFVKEIANFD